MTQLELVRAVLAFYGGDAGRWRHRSLGRVAYESERRAKVGDRNAAVHALASALELGTGVDMHQWQCATGRTFAEVEQRLREAEARLAGEETGR